MGNSVFRDDDGHEVVRRGDIGPLIPVDIAAGVYVRVGLSGEDGAGADPDGDGKAQKREAWKRRPGADR